MLFSKCLQTDVSFETRDRLAVIGNPVKHKLPILANSSTLGDRLVSAFGTDDKEKIAKILGFASKQSVYKVISGERELDFERLKVFRNYTKRSIDWLLTGEGPEFVADSDKAAIGIDDDLYARLWLLAEEQAHEAFGDADIAGINTRIATTFDLLVEYLIAVGLSEFNLLDSPFDALDSNHISRIRRFTLRRISIEERLRQLVREETARSESVGGEVGPMKREQLITVQHRGIVGGGEEDEIEEQPRRRKTG